MTLDRKMKCRAYPVRIKVVLHILENKDSDFTKQDEEKTRTGESTKKHNGIHTAADMHIGGKNEKKKKK